MEDKQFLRAEIQMANKNGNQNHNVIPSHF